jgi:flagellar protein FliS
MSIKHPAYQPINRATGPSLPPTQQEPSLATYAGNQSAAYKQQSILTAPPGRLVVMLYDGCLRFLFQSAYAMREGDRRQSQDRMRRAEAIIDELTVTLDHERGGEIASRLQGIYAFCRRHLIEAAAEQDPNKIEEVSELLGELREAWAEIAGSES